MESIRLIINSLSLYLHITIPEGRRLINKKVSIIFKIGSASPLLLSLTAVLPQSVSCLLKLPTMINLSCGNPSNTWNQPFRLPTSTSFLAISCGPNQALFKHPKSMLNGSLIV